jgi:hypothetical protein
MFLYYEDDLEIKCDEIKVYAERIALTKLNTARHLRSASITHIIFHLTIR